MRALTIYEEGDMTLKPIIGPEKTLKGALLTVLEEPIFLSNHYLTQLKEMLEALNEDYQDYRREDTDSPRVG